MKERNLILQLYNRYINNLNRPFTKIVAKGYKALTLQNFINQLQLELQLLANNSHNNFKIILILLSNSENNIK